MLKSKAYKIYNENDKIFGKIENVKINDPESNEVQIKIFFSSVNYKDALAATGLGKIIRNYPCIGGIDLAGIVTKSNDKKFKEGDEVVATSYGIGVSQDGGFSEYATVPAKWVLNLPKNMSLFESMSLGTAGLTAGLAIERMEKNGLKPENGPIIISGATGGVGSLAIDMLSSNNYECTALTGKEYEENFLKQIGAKEILNRNNIDLDKIKPLGNSIWAGAIDNLGGPVLSYISSQMKPFGTIASIGLALNHSFKASVMPFILRSVSILGIDSVFAPMSIRQKVWERLALDLKPKNLNDIIKVINLEQLPELFTNIMEAKIKGRFIVKIHD